MNTLGIYEAKTRLSALVAELEAGGEGFLLTRHGRVVAELRRHSGVVAPKRGCLKSGQFVLGDDFDAPEAGFEDFFGRENQAPAGTPAAALVGGRSSS